MKTRAIRNTYLKIKEMYERGEISSPTLATLTSDKRAWKALQELGLPRLNGDDLYILVRMVRCYIKGGGE